MCILFVHVNANALNNEYKLVLASNRDEFYNRKTLPAHFWERNEQILGGMDMEPGREGGTWLAVNTQAGKIGTLLNITSKGISPDKRGRGRLVPDFLIDPGDGLAYTNALAKDGDQYNPFNLVVINNLEFEPSITYFSPIAKDGPITLDSVGTYGFGNSAYDTPYKKVKEGRKQFETLMNNFRTNDHEDKIISGLLDILKSSHKNFPDRQLQIQASSFGDDFMQSMSSRYVHIPSSQYGTRTHTMILVRGDNQASFREWTMEEPIINSHEPTWKSSEFSFIINSRAKI